MPLFQMFTFTTPPVWESFTRRQVQIDWDDVGTFTHYLTDVTEYVLDLEDFRGRSEPETLRGRCEPGTSDVVLDNRSGLFSPLNPTGSLFGSLIPGHRIRFGILVPVTLDRWQGTITDIRQERWGEDALPVTIITARGALQDIADVRVNPPADSGSLTGTVMGKILDAGGWSASLRTIDVGQTTMSPWYVSDRPGLEAGREVEEAEQGLLSESPAHHIVFRDRAYRSSGARLTSQATYSDAPGATFPYTKITVADPNKNIVNLVRAKVTPYTTNALADLWTLTGETPTIGPGQSKTWYAEVSSPVLYVAAWTTVTNTTDLTVSGVALSDLTVVCVKYATTMKITITNNHVSNVATITLLKARGTAVVGGSPTTVEASDAASIAKFRTRSYQLASPWLPNTNTAQAYVDSIKTAHKDPQYPVYLTFAASMTDALLSELMTRDLHDRVTVIAGEPRTALYLAGDFHIESIRDHWNVQVGRHDVTLGLSQAVNNAGAWILGTSILGTNTYIGF